MNIDKVIFVLAWLLSWTVAPPVHAQTTFAEHQVVVRLEPDGDIELLNDQFGTTVLSSIPSEGIFLLELPEALDESWLVEILAGLKGVDWAELNGFMWTMDGTTGSFFFSLEPFAYPDQYAIDLINPIAPEGGSPVPVAVLDTGVDATHPALAGRILPGGLDLVGDDGDPDDTGNGLDDDGDGLVDELTGHGTHVAGVVALAAPAAGIIPFRVLDSDGMGTSFLAARGVIEAVDAGARIVNLSFGSATEFQALTSAITRARESGVTVVAAAGNHDQEDPPWHPAMHPDTIAVAATDAADVKSDFSNYGQFVTISAPGTQIVSTLPGNTYGAADGTSFAAAFVTAAAAALDDAGATGPEQIAQVLMEAAADLDGANPDFTGALGAGRLDIGAAAALLPAAGPCPADLDGDGVVGTADLLVLLGAWGAGAAHPADIDGNGLVAASDLLALLAGWGDCS